MSSRSTDAICRRGVRETTPGMYGDVLRALPVTLTVVLGPFITMAYRLTQSTDAPKGSFSLAQAARGLLCILMFLSLFFSRRLRLLGHRLTRPLLFLAIYATSTAVTSPYPYENSVFGVKMVFATLVFASAFQIAEAKLSGERWLTTCAWIVLVVMAMCIGVGLAAGKTVDIYKSRYATAGLIGEPFVASCLILSTLPVFIRLISNGGAAVAGTVLLFASLFFTMCRSALIAAAVATGSSLLINLSSLGRRIPWRRTLVPLAVLILLAGVGLGTAAGADLIERFRDLNPLVGTGSGRYVFWRISLEHIMNRPMHVQLVGEGMGSIRNVIRQGSGRWIGAHNDWLDFIYALGVWGLIGLSWWYFELARLAWRLRGPQDRLFQGVWAALIVLGLIYMGTGGFFEPSWALTYAALGFWAGHATSERQHCPIRSD